jgi:hypothetical protein
VPVGNKIKTLIIAAVLEFYPVLESPVKVSQMQVTCGPHATQYSLLYQFMSLSSAAKIDFEIF